ncbi:MAG: YeeE/YedE thiosulfate transporter family protein [Acidobacteriota bacterium]
MTNDHTRKDYSNPYLAGVLLGLTLLASFVVLGAGLGASGGMARLAASIEGAVASGHTLSSEYFGKWGDSPLTYYLSFMLLGTFLGGLISAVQANRVHLELERGRSAPPKLRAVLAMVGGILVGFASRLAQGCTSGQALTGGAMLLSGSLLFLLCTFAGGFAAARFTRRQWDD